MGVRVRAVTVVPRGCPTEMPQGASTEKRERQYEHIREGEKNLGRSTESAERIAAATVNKTRSEKGEAKSTKKKS